MQLTPVESSHIEAVGYLESDRVLLVRYKDGSLYARPGWSLEHFVRLVGSTSKGKFLRATEGASVLIRKGGDASVPDDSAGSAARPAAGRPTRPPAALHPRRRHRCIR